MKIAFKFFLFAILCGFVQASVITFEDLTVDDEYYVGDLFTSGNVQITAEEFGGVTDGYALVQAPIPTNAGGIGKELWLNNINLDFDFSFAAFEGVSLQYGYYGGDVSLEINGVPYISGGGFTSLNGMMMNGAMVSVVDASDKGAIFATGPIDSFSIGGQELAIDNVIACIPEPATLLLFGLGGGLSLIRKRK